VRGFVAAVERGEEPVAPNEPIARIVHEMLAKVAPKQAPKAETKVAKDDAALAKAVDTDLQALVKMQTAKAFDRLEKGALGALGIGRKAAMRAMMAAGRSARASSMAAGAPRAAAAAQQARDKMALGVAARGKPVRPRRGRSSESG
jgi:hypothetical protein